jgi:hypothetical protein
VIGLGFGLTFNFVGPRIILASGLGLGLVLLLELGLGLF